MTESQSQSTSDVVIPPIRERLRCPECLAIFRSRYTYCPQDGAELMPCGDEPMLGATIAERYVIEEVVGEGAMGMVYRARHVRLPRTFAVKVLFGDLASDATMRMRFAQEAAAASQLSHPNLVPVVDFGKSERGLLYLVMDFVEGETLAQLIDREAPLDPLRVVELTRAMAHGLAHAHAQGLVHRDFKPDNVVLEHREDAAPVPRILDFGLAISARNELDARITQDGWVVGTPVYISPEQARDLPIDHRADLFALGVVMYEMLVGRPPFEGPAMDVAHKNMAEPMPSMALRNPDVAVPVELEAVVMRLVAKAPEQRFQSAEELLAALDRAEQSLSMVRPTVVDLPRVAVAFDDPVEREGFAMESSWTEPARRRRSAAAMAVLAAAAVVAWAVLARNGAREEEVAAIAEAPRTIEVTETDRPAEEVAVAPAEDPNPNPSPNAIPDPIPSTSTSTIPSTSTGPAMFGAPAAPAKVGPRPKVQAARVPRSPRPAPRPEAVEDEEKSLVTDEELDRVDALARAAGIREERDEPEAPQATEPARPEPAAVVAPEREPQPSGGVTVARLVKEYRDVGNALVELQETRGSAAAQTYRNRYFQVPYSDALRIPAVRRDALALLSALRSDIRRELRR